ncbi:hypothetical protein PUNSTDRAFT_85985 [Punctularia strigosozonata HHB-11173 SS5]|uniref:uncharacterized protein n=1 Tax=Punctularia strigosozonata (strain HHB-11173) TaxID=741275 RepID=UPI0004416520|nr:uncharacterized protein PUNSTDRAFT_85985 [Punctularia strigosozonata HHB-11173 SS5]EIN09561.1 hypothetical protein PUNSTDRAFT_85985 [Punctularia strigosozonata HHB-11173 SS5]
MSVEAPALLASHTIFTSKARLSSPSPSRTPLLPMHTSNNATVPTLIQTGLPIMDTTLPTPLTTLVVDGAQISHSPPPSTESTSDGPLSDLGKDASTDVDPQILEALKSKDRLFVLKVGQIMEGLIKEQQQRVEVQASTSYQRLLVHRCAAYYKCTPEADPVTKNLAIVKTIESRIPIRRLSELVPAESQSLPAFKIMRRSSKERGKTKSRSHTSSVAGEDADLSDAEPSESGSVGGRSNATSGRKHLTIAEREAAYNEARTRIFMDFQDKDKDKDMSASSSTFSLVSGSASTSEGGGRSDLDDTASTAPTESEWSGPVSRDKKGAPGSTSAGSSRSRRSNYRTGGSTRNSRAPSPSFTYASIYEPTSGVASTSYDQGDVPPPGYIFYAYPPPGQVAPPAGFYPAYPYYAYPYPPPPPHPHSQSEPTSGHATPEIYGHPHQVPYPGAYAWAPAQQGALTPGSAPPPQTPNMQPAAPHGSPPPMPRNPQYGTPWPAMPPAPYGPYPAPGYYSQSMSYVPGQPAPPALPPQMHGQAVYSQEMAPPPPPHMNGRAPSNGSMSSQHSRASSRSSSVSGGAKRVAPSVRPTWSYGPPNSMYAYGSGGSMGGETVGPRLSSSMRRTSATSSVGSVSNGNRTPSDEASSTVSSSTTSSSSRRTYTSTSTSSKHPLPARPDWAINLKPQPTLHSNSRSRTASAGTTHGPPLQATDFPPLSVASSTPKAPPAAGAWGKPPANKSILTPNNQTSGSNGNALVQYPAPSANGGASGRTSPTPEEYQDRVPERPFAKGPEPSHANPKVATEKVPADERSGIADGNATAEQMQRLSLDDSTRPGTV